MAADDARPLVLVVEPDSDTADMYAEFFDLNGWRPETAGDGASGVSKAITLLPDVITIEPWLPVIDGVRAVEILKADPQTAAIPVIAVTSDARSDEIARITAAGCATVFKKPCLPEDLLGALNRERARARELRHVSATLRNRAARLKERSVQLQARSVAAGRRARAVSVKTTTPDAPPPLVTCPSCATLLIYDYSVIGGVVTHREQWDYLRCPNGCGVFEYRQRTRRVRPA